MDGGCATYDADYIRECSQLITLAVRGGLYGKLQVCGGAGAEIFRAAVLPAGRSAAAAAVFLAVMGKELGH